MKRKKREKKDIEKKKKVNLYFQVNILKKQSLIYLLIKSTNLLEKNDVKKAIF